MSGEATLGTKATRAAAWSGVSTIVLRAGGFAVGIVLARVLGPEQFGVYAVALTVQAVLMAVADLGLSAELIRSADHERRAPTVATLGLVTGTILAAATVLASRPLAEALGAPDAAPAVAVLGVTLALGGAGVVPLAELQRSFNQRALFIVAIADFVVSTSVTLGLVTLGWGALAIAVGRLAAQVVATVLQFVLARVRPVFRVDRSLLRPILAFGLPVAGANVLSWALLNIDNVVLARVAGATTLGFYVLAFNISNWPMSVLSQMLRSVALPYFSQAGDARGALNRLVGVAWAFSLPAGITIAVLARPIVEMVYGEAWLAAVPALAALGFFGCLRVPFDVFASYLYAIGRSRPVLWVQVVWFVVLTAGMIVATRAWGIVGAGWVHVVVAVAVILPAFAIALRSSGVSLRALAAACWVPCAAAVPAAAVAMLATRLESPVAATLLGGAGALLTYLVLAGPWLLRGWRTLRAAPAVAAEPAAAL
ncbi:oligosaccharide flippase family protein [Xylanimonas sp. McL0601]|uniref:oligosaccharide flippase family protein n=1 Tax=Xylanimonas sp. McL0601 TaxID=3414739 RepID=UPI003CF71F22